MGQRFAWILNFDAERELASPVGYRTATATMRARMRVLDANVVATGLVRREDVIAVEGARVAGTFLGRAWCPTPWALARIRDAGAKVPEAPPLHVLRRVNARRFSTALGSTLPGAVYATGVADVERATREGGDWLLKRELGFAGRGRRKVRGAALTADDIAWILHACRDDGGLEVEPWVSIDLDVALHGHVDREARVVLGAPTLQRCDAAGAWLSSELAPDGALSLSEHAALAAEGARVGGALARAGYFGPFGIDAYTWRDARGASHFNPRGEINARYTMAWALGMDGRRESIHA
jgi:hypothetical protein